MDMVKLCVDPYTNKVVNMCGRKEKSNKAEEITCCMCSSKSYVSVDKLSRWIELLGKSGSNTKGLVRDEMIELLNSLGSDNLKIVKNEERVKSYEAN